MTTSINVYADHHVKASLDKFDIAFSSQYRVTKFSNNPYSLNGLIDTNASEASVPAGSAASNTFFKGMQNTLYFYDKKTGLKGSL